METNDVSQNENATDNIVLPEVDEILDPLFVPRNSNSKG